MRLLLQMCVWGTTGAMTMAAASVPMSVDQQNGLVQKYCAVCHTDAIPNGRLSLQHFDAAHPDPGLAAMMVSKLKAGALGAAGGKLPDRPTQDALLSALSEEAVGANAWFVDRSREPVLAASVVQAIPASTIGSEPDLYRLTVSCRPDTHEREILLTWAPGVPGSGQAMSVSVDGGTPFTYKVEGSEKMGNRQAGTSGPGAAVLTATPLPEQSLTINNLLQNETVVFLFGDLAPVVRQRLSACFGQEAGADSLRRTSK